MTADQSPPRPRFIALGASNVRLGFASLAATARAVAAGPVDVWAAMGHGRSYGHASRVAVRTLPGILQCGLWEQLQQQPQAPTTALITDVGNDLLYGDGPQQLIAWVTECVERLNAHGARVIVTELPTPSLTRLGPMRYRLFRTFFFPTYPLTLNDIQQHAIEVNDALQRLVATHGIVLKKLQPEWYGFDPIHYKRACRAIVWKKILGLDQASDSSIEVKGLSKTKRLKIIFSRPHERALLGFSLRAKQPCLSLEDGTRFFLF